MKTLADFKRALQVGTVWQRKHFAETDFVKRTVTRVQSRGIWVADEEGRQSLLTFPKATEFEINANGEAEIYWPTDWTWQGLNRVEIPRRLVLTYRKA